MRAESSARRRYRSPRREQQAADTRAAMLAAAVELFGARGWAATGMRDVARAAEVSVETVYSNFRSKAELLMAAIDMSVVGDTDALALADRPEFAQLASGTRRQRAQAAARLMTAIQQRTADLHHALRQAAAISEELAQRLHEDEERRRISVEQGASLVAGRPVTAEERDGLWAVLAIEVYRLLTRSSGWSPQQYEAWIADVILRLLNDEDSIDGSTSTE